MDLVVKAGEDAKQNAGSGEDAEQAVFLASQAEFKKQMLLIGKHERMNNLYRIQDKTGKVVQFKQNVEQIDFHQTRLGRDVILKSRQVGFTTDACIDAYDSAIFEKLRCGIMAHVQELVKVIFDKVKLANEYFMKDWGHLYPLEDEANNTTMISWKNIKAAVLVRYSFQGYTLNRLHVSEAAFIESERLTFSMQAVPESGSIILESTPNGPGGFFYNTWQAWKKLKGSAPFRGYFVPWFKHYPENPEKWQTTDPLFYSDVEKQLIENYNLKDHHILWRRFKIQESCEGSDEVFEKQYPADDRTCFLSGENAVYPSSVLTNQERFVVEPSYVGSIKLTDNKKVEFYADKAGLISIWDLPEPGKVYYGGADPSGGSGSDPGSICVINADTGEQVAELHGYLDPDLFADELYKLGHLYNQCFWCIEANNHGEAVILKLKGLYPNLYRKQEFNTISKKYEQKIGFNTSNSSKITITNNHVAACRDAKFRTRSKGLLAEMGTFLQLAGKHGKTLRREARSDCHDDRVMSACLAWEMKRSRPLSDSNEDYDIRPEGMTVDPDTGFFVPIGAEY